VSEAAGRVEPQSNIFVGILVTSWGTEIFVLLFWVLGTGWIMWRVL